MRVICAPDKLRGSLDAAQAAAALAAGVTAAGAIPIEHPLADGGEGSRATVQAARGGTVSHVDATDAYGRPTRIPVGRLDDGTALIEAAEVVGWANPVPGRCQVMRASSAGLAAPILAAVAQGARRIVVFLGGTATMDGGTGLLAGLGATLLDADQRGLTGSGTDLTRIRTLDLGSARQWLAGVDLVVAADVISPLSGPHGAAHLFGPQKGAMPEDIDALDAGLRRLGALLGIEGAAGGGAAGGLGAALLALGATMQPGAALIRELTRFDQQLAAADLCLTAEGKIDASTDAGKTVSGVIDACRNGGPPCVVLGGTLTPDADRLYQRGATAVLPIGPAPRDLDTALRHAADDLTRSAHAVSRLASDILSRRPDDQAPDPQDRDSAGADTQQRVRPITVGKGLSRSSG